MTSELEFLKTVKELDIKLSEKISERDKIKEQADAATTEMNRIFSQMGFRERYLNGWFFGNREQVETHKKMKLISAKFSEKASHHEYIIEKLQNELKTTIHTHLDQTNAAYKALYKIHTIFTDIKGTVEILKQSITRAKKEVEDATSMEWADLATNNAGISWMSYTETEEAKEALNTINHSVEDLKDKLKKYQDFLEESNLKTVEGLPDDTLDFYLDLFLDGFDFMSIFALEKLEKARDAIENLEQKARPLFEKIETQFQKSEAIINKNIAEKHKEIIKAATTAKPEIADIKR